MQYVRYDMTVEEEGTVCLHPFRYATMMFDAVHSNIIQPKCPISTPDQAAPVSSLLRSCSPSLHLVAEQLLRQSHTAPQPIRRPAQIQPGRQPVVWHVSMTSKQTSPICRMPSHRGKIYLLRLPPQDSRNAILPCQRRHPF